MKKKKPKHYDKHSKLPWYLRPDTVVWGRRELKTRYITESEFCTLKDGGKKCAEKLH